MVSENYIYNTAKQIISKCGKRFSPKEYVKSKLCILTNNGDIDGIAIWKQIEQTIDELLNNPHMKNIIK